MNWQDEFPQDPSLAYLNHAAVGVWPRRTAEAIAAFAQENVARGAQNYPQWLDTDRALRVRLAQLINAPSHANIALLKSTSEALSVVAYGLDWQSGDNVVITDQEFPSNSIVWESLADKGVAVKIATISGADDPEAVILESIDSNTRLVSVSSVQYASGLRLDCKRLGEALKSTEVLFCIDAIQSIGAVPFDVQEYHADFVAADGHKWMLSAEGLAVFYTTRQARDKLKLQQFGWHMVKHRGDYDRKDWEPTSSAMRFECGSPNMLGIYALNASLSLLEEVGMAKVSELLQSNIEYLIAHVQTNDELTLISPAAASRRGGIVTFKHNKKDSKALHQALMDQGVICAYRGGGVRFSPHFYTSKDTLDRALKLVDS